MNPLLVNIIMISLIVRANTSHGLSLRFDYHLGCASLAIIHHMAQCASARASGLAQVVHVRVEICMTRSDPVCVFRQDPYLQLADGVCEHVKNQTRTLERRH